MKPAAALLLGLWLLLAGCAEPARLPGSETAPPFTATPGPTAPATEEPVEKPVWFESREFGFRLRLPAGYQPADLPRRDGILLDVGIAPAGADPGPEGHPLRLAVYAKPAGLPLLDWFSNHIGDPPAPGALPADQVFFYSPAIQNQADVQGAAALQYLAGAWPVPFETLVDRGDWVIGLSYLTDYPIDHGPIYAELLASLAFFTAEMGHPALTPAPPEAAPAACLDEEAAPRPLPPRQNPLEVHFISGGNIWTWDETQATARQITDTGDALSFSFSPDGSLLAFTRGPQGGQAELWGIRRDGTRLLRLASAEQLHALAGEPSHTEIAFSDGVVYREWIAGGRALAFEIQRSYDAIGGCCESGGTWQVDLDTGELSAWTPPEPAAAAAGPAGMLSPDGRQIALIEGSQLHLVDADGSNRREAVFSFITAPVHEGGGTIYPYIAWAADSQSLAAITFDGDPYYADDSTSTTWRIPVDGSPAQALHTFRASFFWMYPSPDQEYLVYKTRVRPLTNDYELHLASFDGAQDFVYLAQHGAEFLHWHPDSFHFVHDQWSIFHPQLGSVCGGSVPLLDRAESPAIWIDWVDADRFLYVQGQIEPWAGPRELKIGRLGGSPLVIGPFNGDAAHYVFNAEAAPLGAAPRGPEE